MSWFVQEPKQVVIHGEEVPPKTQKHNALMHTFRMYCYTGDEVTTGIDNIKKKKKKTFSSINL